MAFNIEMIKDVYQSIKRKVDHARKIKGTPLTLAEKILYSHLWNPKIEKPFKRGEDYVDFAPDRIACQDATAQMALLQFMQAGKNKVAVPTTVHCDHLIQAAVGASKDLQLALFSIPFELIYSSFDTDSRRISQSTHTLVLRGRCFPQ